MRVKRSVRHAFAPVRHWVLRAPVAAAVAVAVGVGVVSGVPAQAAPSSAPTTTSPSSPRAPYDRPDGDVDSSADADAQAAARAEVPVADTSTDQGPQVPQTELAAALDAAEETGERVEVVGETTATSITWAMPDGTAQVEASAGPARVQQENGTWEPVDTTLELTDEGVVGPRMVPGDTQFSGGGDDLLASLSDGAGTTVTMSWSGPLPTPVLDGDTATYPDVLPDVDLVLTANRLGFSQLLVVNSRPDATTLAALASIDIPVVTTGADIVEAAGGELQVIDAETDELLGTAAAPLMWDARTNPRTDEPVAVRPIGVEVATEDVAEGTSQGSANLTLSPDTAFLTDPTTVYPVTIDPTQTLGALGDSFVQKGFSSNQGGTTDLRAGTYNGGGDVARSWMRFDVSALKNRIVQSANLGLWEFHSYSCSPRWVDIRDGGDFNPATITWNNQPWIGGIMGNANAARGYSSSCPAGWVNFNLTGWAQFYADSRNNMPNVMPLVIQVGDERDNYAWKKFNSGNAASNVPTLTFTFDGACDQYAGNSVCGAIRDKWWALGGPNSYVGMPTNSETGINGGAYSNFQRGAIYWSPSTGAHNIQGAIYNRWAQLGYQNGLGLPVTDETPTSQREGAFNHFTGGSIFWSPYTAAWEISGPIRDKWASLGWENGPWGFPTSSYNSNAQPDHFHQYFEGDILATLTASTAQAHYVTGAIKTQYGALDYERSYLGWPTSDPYQVASGQRSDFEGGQITADAATGTTDWSAGPTSSAGLPTWATTSSWSISGTTTAAVNAGTGNLTIAVDGITVPGLADDKTIGLVYNSLAGATGSTDPTTTTLGRGWRLNDSVGTRLVTYADGSVRYTDATGRGFVYENNVAAGTWTPQTGDLETSLTKNSGGDWVRTVLATNRTQTFRAADGLLVRDADRNGNAYAYAYDSAGNPVSVTGIRSGGAPVTFTLGGSAPAGHIASMSQQVNGTTRTVSFGYAAAADTLTSVTDTLGGVTTFGWTGSDITTITAPGGRVTTIGYDTGHRATNVVNDAGSGRFNATTTFAYTAPNNVATTAVTVTQNTNVQATTTYTFDAFGKAATATDALGRTQTTAYNPNRDVVRLTAPTTAVTTYGFTDANGGYQPALAQSPTGAKTTATYPTTGTGPLRYLPSSSTDTQGNVTTYTYDAAGNRTAATVGGITTTATYNPASGTAATCGGRPGQMCSQTDGNGNTTRYEYDTTGNLTRIVPPVGGVLQPTTSTYDTAGRLTTSVDGNSKTTTYRYDAADRITTTRYGNATSCTNPADCEIFTYDALGQLTARTDGSGTAAYTYDALGRQTTQQLPTAAGGTQTSTYSYDLAGNLLTYTDAGGTVTYGYDKVNNLTSLAEPNGSCTAATPTGCTTFAYDANNVRTLTTYPGGTRIEYSNIDASQRPLKYKATNAAGAVLMDITLTYQRAGADTGLIQTRTDAAAPGGTATTSYTYDSLNRLTRALETVSGAASASWAYCYDSNSNRTYDTTSTAATVLCPGQTGGPTAAYSYDAADALTSMAGQPSSAFTYDGNGAATTYKGTANAWTASGNQSTTGSTAFGYTGSGNSERLSAGSTTFTRGALGVTAQVSSQSSSYIREPNGALIATRLNGATFYYIADNQDSITCLVDGAGTVKNTYRYDPYGQSRTKSETVVNPWQYIGAQLDSSGYYWLQNRYYDPQTGRFLQQDPSAQDALTYGYAHGNPVNFSDPDGLKPRPRKPARSCYNSYICTGGSTASSTGGRTSNCVYSYDPCGTKPGNLRYAACTAGTLFGAALSFIPGTRKWVTVAGWAFAVLGVRCVISG